MQSIGIPPKEDVRLKTDRSLLSRGLSNMVINALEASTPKQKVELWVEHLNESLVFFVQNAQVIPELIALRIFERNFSTKSKSGRGLGTFSMKLFGEQILGGKVSFTSTEKKGTIFQLALPLLQSSDSKEE